MTQRRDDIKYTKILFQSLLQKKKKKKKKKKIEIFLQEEDKKGKT